MTMYKTTPTATHVFLMYTHMFIDPVREIVFLHLFQFRTSEKHKPRAVG